MSMVTLYKILACHMVGDYVFQIDYIAKTKGDNWWHLLSHCVSCGHTRPHTAGSEEDLLMI